jgi:hypothetical protein
MRTASRNWRDRAAVSVVVFISLAQQVVGAQSLQEGGTGIRALGGISWPTLTRGIQETQPRAGWMVGVALTLAEDRRIAAVLEVDGGRTGFVRLIPPNNREDETRFSFVDIPIYARIRISSGTRTSVYVLGGFAFGRQFSVRQRNGGQVVNRDAQRSAAVVVGAGVQLARVFAFQPRVRGALPDVAIRVPRAGQPTPDAWLTNAGPCTRTGRKRHQMWQANMLDRARVSGAGLIP